MAGNTNNIFVIIQAVDKATKTTKKIEGGFQKLQKSVQSGVKGFRDMSLGAGIAIGILYSMFQAVEGLADRFDKLGDKKTAAALRSIGQEADSLVNVIITLETGFGSVGEVIQKLIPFVLIPFKGIGIGAELASGAVQQIVILFQRLFGIMQELQGKSTEFTAEWYRVNKELIFTETILKANTIAFGKMEDAVEKSTNRVKSQKKAVKALSDEWNKLWARSEAIRSGDALALAGMMGGGKGGGGGGARGSGGGLGGHGAPRSDPKNGGITVVIGGEVVDNRVRQVIKNELIAPVVKKSGGRPKSGGR